MFPVHLSDVFQASEYITGFCLRELVQGTIAIFLEAFIDISLDKQIVWIFLNPHSDVFILHVNLAGWYHFDGKFLSAFVSIKVGTVLKCSTSHITFITNLY